MINSSEIIKIVYDKLENSSSYEKLKQVLPGIKSFHHHIHILYDLRDLLSSDEKVYMEIGSYCGGSAALMLSHPNKTHVYCIDPLNLNKSHYGGTTSQYETLKQNLELKKGNNTYEIFKSYSNDKGLLNLLKERNIKADILFIDGDHSYNAVLNDFYNYHEFVNPGGFIVFDDYVDNEYSPQVRPAVDKIVKDIEEHSLPYEIIGSLPNFQDAYSIYPKKFLTDFILYKKTDSKI